MIYSFEYLVGRTVKLKDKNETAKIECIYTDIEGGVRLDKQLDGFWSWNITDLDVLPDNQKMVENEDLARQTQKEF